MIKKRELFPTELVVFRDEYNALWAKYLEWLNDGFAEVEAEPHFKFHGDIQCYYGLLGDCPIMVSDVTEGQKLFTLNEWWSLYDTGEPYVEPMTTCHDGCENPTALCVEMHNGEFALRYDCVALYIDGDREWVLEEDTNETICGTRFLVNDTPDNIRWSEYNEAWIDEDNDYTMYGYINRREEDYFYDRYGEEHVEINGQIYATGSIAGEHGYEWDDDSEEWYHENDRPVSIQSTNCGYHRLERVLKFNDNAVATIGFEIEKEDAEAGDVHYSSLYSDTKWIKESDASLCSYAGYELVSPAFNLYDSSLEDEINSDERLISLINANHSVNCGGHINLAVKGFNSEQLFEGVSAFLPLIYALYPARTSNKSSTDYSKRRKKHKYYDKDKFSAVYIKDNVLEFRAPSAVRNVTNLLWRRDLMRIIVDNINKSEVEVLRMMLTHSSKLYKHLRKVYTQEQLVDKTELFIKLAEDFNNKVLPPIIRKDIKKDKLDDIDTTSELGA